MKYTLRTYQEEAVQSVFTYFQNKAGNPLIALPGGTGKSLVIGDFIMRALAAYPTTKVMMLTHVSELIGQNFEKLVSMWPKAPAGLYSATLKSKTTTKPITFGQIQSVANNVEAFGHVDLVVIDEAHLVSASQNTSYRKVLGQLQEVNPNLKVIGLTATPYRMGLGTLLDGGIFTDFCYNKTSMEDFNWFIDEGYLSMLVPKATSTTMDVSGVKSTGEDYVLTHLQAAVDTDELTKAICKETVETAYASDRKKWLVYASGIEHTEHVCAELQRLGIKADYVHSKMKKQGKDRDTIINDFKDGDLTCIVNNGVLTTGNDFPKLDLIVIMRPTKSVPLWVQILSRGTRLSTGKENCLVLDFGGNTARLGPINDPVLPRKKGAKKGSGEAPVRLCDQCQTYNHARAKVCVTCGHEFPVQSKLTVLASNKDIVATGKKEIIKFDVGTVVYSRHEKLNKIPSLKVSYQCGIRVFSEYICLEHPLGNFAAVKARTWWRCRTLLPIPETVNVALANVNNLPQPTSIDVDVAGKYPSIQKHYFNTGE